MRRFEAYRGDDAGVERHFPEVNANAPVVTRLQSGKAPVRMWRDQIVADGPLMLEKRCCHLDADGVLAGIIRPRITLAVAIKPGERVRTAGLQHSAEDVLNHVASVARTRAVVCPYTKNRAQWKSGLALDISQASEQLPIPNFYSFILLHKNLL